MAATFKINQLSTSELVRLRAQVDARIQDAVSALESQLVELRGATANGSARGGRKPGRRAGGSRKGTRGLRPGSLTSKVVEALSAAKGPMSIADLMGKTGVSAQKLSLNQALVQLKKRGLIKNPERGVYASA